jgi:hypothetical protein
LAGIDDAVVLAAIKLCVALLFKEGGAIQVRLLPVLGRAVDNSHHNRILVMIAAAAAAAHH